MNVIERIKKGELILQVREVVGVELPGLVYCENHEDREEIIKLAKLGQQMQWVSVAERLPEVGEIIDVWKGNKRFIDMEVKSDDDGIYFDATIECHVFGIEEVAHWMLIPEPPKGVE